MTARGKGTRIRRRLLRGDALGRRVDEMAERLAASDTERLALVGIRTGGGPLAERLADRLEALSGARPPVGRLDITLYRDDVFDSLEQPRVGPTEIDFDIAGRTVALVDDVLFTGRTVRAAIDALMDLGRPRRVLLVVLVDRGGRELPIAPDVVGATVPAEADETVEVRLRETGGEDSVVVLGKTKTS